jgi:hypothetical protein
MVDWQNRLRRLIALAEDQAGTPEGDLAARLAREIMAARRSELKGLDLHARNDRDPFTRKTLDLGGRAFWRRRVASITARHCDGLCSFVEQEARLSGRRSSVLVAEFLYRVTSRSIAMEQAAWLGEHQLFDEARAANDFAQSAVLALDSRLQGMRQAEVDLPEVTALVRSDREALRKWLAQRGVRLKREVPFPFAYSQEGYEAGYRVPIQKSVATE